MRIKQNTIQLLIIASMSLWLLGGTYINEIIYVNMYTKNIDFK